MQAVAPDMAAAALQYMCVYGLRSGGGGGAGRLARGANDQRKRKGYGGGGSGGRQSPRPAFKYPRREGGGLEERQKNTESAIGPIA